MKKTRTYDLTNKYDLMKIVDMQKLATPEGASEMLKHLIVYDLFLAATNNADFLDMLEKLGVEARKLFILQSEEVGKLAMQAAKKHIDKEESA